MNSSTLRTKNSKIECSQTLFNKANSYIPGGVNSPVRSFRSVNGDPIFMEHGSGAYLYDVDGNEYIDYLCSWGPLILGHANPKVVEQVKLAIENGLGFGTATEIEIHIAAKICEYMPNIEMIRMVNSGTEATMTAIRVARAYTQRNKIIKFTGCYHGHSDSLLVNAGSGALTLGVPSSPGVPEDLVQHTLVADFNDLSSVEACFKQYANDIAGIIVEPVAGNMNCILGKKQFLQGLRELCDHYQSVLIFDEVMSGFRVTLGGAQNYYNIKPDLTTLGKVIGGGLPVGAFGGKKVIMETLSPLGPVYQAGTLSGNPVAMTAGLTTLQQLHKPGFYTELQRLTQRLLEGLQKIAANYHIPFTTNQAYSMFGFFFTDCEQVTNYKQATEVNIDHFKQFFHGMLNAGVYFAPSAFETGFISSAHTDKHIDATLNAAEHIFKKLK